MPKAFLYSSDRQLPFYPACTTGSILFVVEKNSWIKTGDQMQRMASHIRSAPLSPRTDNRTYRELKVLKPVVTVYRTKDVKTENTSKHK